MGISVSSYYTYRHYLENNLIQTTGTNLQFLSDYIDNELYHMDQLVHYCQTNSSIASFVESQSAAGQNRVDAYEQLSEYCQYNASSYLHRVVVMNLAERYIQVVAANYSSTANISQELPMQSFYETLLDPEYQDYTVGFLSDPFYSRRSLMVIPMLKSITYKYNANLSGYIFIEVSDALFADAFANSYQANGGSLYLTLGSHTYRYLDNTFIPVEPDDALQIAEALVSDGSSKVTTVTLSDGSVYTLVSESLAHPGCYVSQLLSPQQLHPTQPAFYWLLALIFVVLFFISILLNKLLDGVINTPVRRIQERLVRIAGGDFSRDTTIEWEHELGDIGKGVNDLAEDVDRLIRTTLEDEKQKRDLEYKMLQSQINPHFLYNTLNSIKWMATIQGATGITEMTTALSRLLKSIAKGTKLIIPLREELDLIQDYFTIQQYRYGGTIQLEVQVDDEALYDCPIIKFTLQPLVENAIFHGIEPTGAPGSITIHAHAAGGRDMQIDITDTGVGMSDEMIEKILHDESVNTSDFFREIGISNVHKRLQYEFGSAYGLSIESQVGEYTTMSIRLPLGQGSV